MVPAEFVTGILRRTRRKLAEGGWTPNLVVGVALTLLGPGIGLTMRSPQWAIYGTAAGLTILIWIFAYHLVQGVEPPSNGGPITASQPVGQPVTNLSVVNGPVTINQGTPGLSPAPTLTPAQERLLQILVALQRRHATSKLVIARHGQTLHFDEPEPHIEAGPLEQLYGSTATEHGTDFERLMESMPSDYVRVFPEFHWDSPFVVGVTDRGMEYLHERRLAAASPLTEAAIIPAESADLESRVRGEAGRSPQAALALVSLELERQLRPFMAATGFHNRAKPGATLPENLDLISETWPYRRASGSRRAVSGMCAKK